MIDCSTEKSKPEPDSPRRENVLLKEGIIKRSQDNILKCFLAMPLAEAQAQLIRRGLLDLGYRQGQLKNI